MDICGIARKRRGLFSPIARYSTSLKEDKAMKQSIVTLAAVAMALCALPAVAADPYVTLHTRRRRWILGRIRGSQRTDGLRRDRVRHLHLRCRWPRADQSAGRCFTTFGASSGRIKNSPFRRARPWAGSRSLRRAGPGTLGWVDTGSAVVLGRLRNSRPRTLLPPGPLRLPRASRGGWRSGGGGNDLLAHRLGGGWVGACNGGGEAGCTP